MCLYYNKIKIVRRSRFELTKLKNDFLANRAAFNKHTINYVYIFYVYICVHIYIYISIT